MTKKIFLIVILIILSYSSYAQSIYIRTFGDSTKTPILFLHGGPGYNCANFEGSVASKIASKGFFVIVYDRRGEGRSKNVKADFTFDQTFDDINHILNQYIKSKVTIVAHSFGAQLAIKFSVKYPEKVKNVVLVGGCIDMQQTLKSILTRAKREFTDKNLKDSLDKIYAIEQMDTSSLKYSSSCFMIAIHNHFYETKQPTQELYEAYNELKKDTLYGLINELTYRAPYGFWKNEHYTTIDSKNELENLIKGGIGVFGIYGRDDGLFTPDVVYAYEQIIGKKNFQYLAACGHSVYLDRANTFISLVTKWMSN